MKTHAVRVVAGVVLITVLAALPATGQFTPTYPVIIVPPPPAQNLVVPKSMPKSSMPQKPPSAEAPPPAPPTPTYQGRTRMMNWF
jgi:hypothetical protein